ncbi:hypothetical protein BRYFOR_09297 [Marvinbryantia formatexigens DSM 14469]|uniref:Uncharacterized protein n=1 Tax=Marvinbryantia formatexigens DSM 14469 TaxID=478749 RepID=C6LKV0_9FIRM|nr:hypothetical protein BRYFOR_09297 [Marvinbryantia formatexigens DSM 14469]
MKSAIRRLSCELSSVNPQKAEIFFLLCGFFSAPSPWYTFC